MGNEYTRQLLNRMYCMCLRNVEYENVEYKNVWDYVTCILANAKIHFSFLPDLDIDFIMDNIAIEMLLRGEY